jgi:hypothetical protein
VPEKVVVFVKLTTEPAQALLGAKLNPATGLSTTVTSMHLVNVLPDPSVTVSVRIYVPCIGQVIVTLAEVALGLMVGVAGPEVTAHR